MKRSTFLIISAAVAVVFGLGFLFFAEPTLKNFGMEISASTLSLARATGVLLVGLGVVNWAIRQEKLTQTVRTIFWANILIHVVTLVLDYMDLTAKTVTASGGWIGVIVHAIFAAGFAYYLFYAKET